LLYQPDPANVINVIEMERVPPQDEFKHLNRPLLAFLSHLDDVCYLVRLGDDPLKSTVEYLNPAVERVFGFTPEEFLRDPRLFSSVVHPEDRDRVAQLTLGAVAHGEPVLRPYRIVLKDGSLRWVEDQMVVLKGSQGQPLFLAGLVRDVTDRDREHRQFQQVIRAIPEGLLVVDEQGHIELANENIEALFGYERQALVGQAIETLLPERFRQHHAQHRSDYAQDAHLRLMGTGLELFGLRQDGSEFPVDIALSPLQLNEGFKVIALIRDVSEQRAQQQAEREQAVQLRRHNEALRQAKAQIERQLQQQESLRLIDAAIVGSFEVASTLNVVLEQTMRQAHVDAASILLLDPHTQTLNCTASKGIRSEEVQQVRLRLSESFAGKAVLERRPLHVPDFSKVRGFVSAPLLEAEGFVSYYGVPMVAKGQVKGVFEVFGRAPLPVSTAWQQFMELLAGQTAIALDSAQLFEHLRQTNTELQLAYDATLEGWVKALDLRDHETQGHTQRVTKITVQLARHLGLSGERLVEVRRGALLHDIGKMAIPDAILLKPGKLEDDEWEVMKRHPSYAYEWLSPIPFLSPALDIPYCHHEKWDGSGYPQSLKGEAIPLVARIFAVVDVWDALRSDRPYRKAWSDQEVQAYVQTQAGTHFDPYVVEAFLSLLNDGPHNDPPASPPAP